MRFLTVITSAEDQEIGEPPAALFAAMGEFAEEFIRNGSLLDQGGLTPTSQAVRIRSEGGTISVTDGPFTETKEVIGGWAMFQLRSMEEAVEVGRRFMQIHAEHWPEFTGYSEIRQIEEPPPGMQP